jgi:hypothetical protein
VSSARTPGTGGVIDLWRNNDGTPSKLATGRWTEAQGRPQGVGKRWRGWYVGDDGKTRTKRFRTEVEAEGWSNAQRGKVVTNQWVSPDLGADAFANLAEQWFRICEASIMAVDAAPDHARRKRMQSAGQPSQRGSMGSMNRFAFRCSTAFGSRRG